MVGDGGRPSARGHGEILVGSRFEAGDGFGRSILDSLPSQVCVLDASGTLIAVNAAWEQFARENGGDPSQTGPGANYLEVCAHVHGKGTSEAAAAAEGIRAVLEGRRRSFSLEYPCHSPGEKRWFLMNATPLRDADGGGVVVAHVSITDRKQYEEALQASEERFCGTFENAAVGMALSTPEGVFLRVNQRLCDIVGYAHEELLGRSWTEITHPDDLETGLASVRSLLLGQASRYSMHKRYIRKDGSIIWVNLTLSAVRGVSGRPEYCIAIVEDINERKRAEIALRDSEERYRRIVETAQEGVWVLDTSGTTTFVNARMADMLGVSPAQMQGKNLFEFMDPEQRGLATEYLDRRHRGIGETHDFRFRKRDGTPLWASLCSSVIRDEDGQVVGVLAMVSDVTERKEAERRLVESQGRLQALFDHALDAFLLTGDDACFLDVNPAACSLFGYSHAELVGLCIAEVAAEPDRDAVREGWGHFLAPSSMEGEFTILTKDGSIRQTEYRAVAQIRPGVHLAILRDITERTRAEAALRESEARFRSIFENAAVGISHASLDGHWQQVNQKFCEIVGYPPEEVLTLSWVDITHPDDLEADLALKQRLLAGEIATNTMPKRYIRKDGSIVWVNLTVSLVRDEHGAPWFFIGVIEDITERKALQEELLTIAEREQRRIGQDLHDDVGQELTGIGLMVEVLRESLEMSGSTEIPLLTRIQARLKYVHQSVRALSRGLVPVEVDARGLMAALEDLANRVAEQHGIACDFACLEPVAIEDNLVATQLYRITQEAIANAVRHASASWIRVSLERQDGHIVLEIRDGGVGIPGDADARGGMGLKIMRYRAELIGGTLSVGPADGGGTAVACIVHGRRADGRDREAVE